MRSCWCISAAICSAFVGVTDCLVNNYLPTTNNIQKIHNGSSQHESRRLPKLVSSKQHSQQKRKIHLYTMSEDDSRENEIRRKVIILSCNIILLFWCTLFCLYNWLLEVNQYMLINKNRLSPLLSLYNHNQCLHLLLSYIENIMQMLD